MSRFDLMMIGLAIRFRYHRVLEQESSHRRGAAEHKHLHTVEAGGEGIQSRPNVDRYRVFSRLHLIYTRVVVVQDVSYLGWNKDRAVCKRGINFSP